MAQVHLRQVAFEHSERGINYFRKVLNSRIIRILTTSSVNIIKIMPYVEGDRSECQPEASSIARSRRLRAMVVVEG